MSDTNGKNGHELATRPKLPVNLPAGASAFQAAVDGKLTKEIWETILDAQIEKAKSGDRGAARFLLEYAGGVASMRGATFVQETHQHDHYHESGSGDMPGPRVTSPRRVEDPAADESDGIPLRTPQDFERGRERVARRAMAGAEQHAGHSRRRVPA